MKFWGIEVKAEDGHVSVMPEEDYHICISQVSLESSIGTNSASSSSSGIVSVEVGGEKFVLGTLVPEYIPQIRLNLCFEKEFQLSHSLNNASVHFIGYTISSGHLIEQTEQSSDDDDDDSEDDGSESAKGMDVAKDDHEDTPIVKDDFAEWHSTTDESEEEDFYVHRKLILSNLNVDTRKSNIVKFFQGVGKPDSIDIPKEVDMDGFRYCYVTFETAFMTNKALELKGKYLLMRPVEIDRVPNQQRALYVGGFDQEIDEKALKDEIRDCFEWYGEVQEIYLPKYKESGRLLGFGYVYMHQDPSCEEACKELNSTIMRGFKIQVRNCHPRYGVIRRAIDAEARVGSES